MPVLEVQHIEKHFDNTKVLEDISFELEQGQALAIIRPDGPGAVTFRAESPYGSAQVTTPCPQEEIG